MTDDLKQGTRFFNPLFQGVSFRSLVRRMLKSKRMGQRPFAKIIRIELRARNKASVVTPSPG